MAEEQARKRVEKEKGFYAGLATYVVVISGLAAVNLLTSPGYLWFLWPMFGWGIGVASHAASVFGMPGLGRGWEQRRVDELLGSEPSEARLRELLDETLADADLPAGQPQSLTRLQRRIEHLEAIVTSRDWDETAAAPPARAPQVPGGLLDDHTDEDDESPAERAARLARRVR